MSSRLEGSLADRKMINHDRSCTAVRAVRDRVTVRPEGHREAADDGRHGRRAGGRAARGGSDRAAGPRAHGSGICLGWAARPLGRGGARWLLSGAADPRACGPACHRLERRGAGGRAGTADTREHRGGDGALSGRRALFPGVHTPPGAAERRKKRVRPSAAGTSSPVEGPNTVEPAATAACPAPEANREPTGDSAPTGSTP
jgi:hypothetical protein